MGLFLQASGQAVADPTLPEGGPFTTAELLVNGVVAATFADGVWTLTNGLAFGRQTGETYRVILGQAK